MSKQRHDLVGLSAGAAFVGLSEHLFRWRVVERGDIKIAAYGPIRIRLSDLITYRAACPPVARRRRAIDRLLVTLAEKTEAHHG
jgi:hypothetical protein